MQKRGLTILSACQDFSWQKLTLFPLVKLQEKKCRRAPQEKKMLVVI